MTPKTHTYSPDQVSLILGSRPIEGWNSITVSRLNDSFTDSVSADGNVGRTKSNDKRADITVTMSDFSSVKISAELRQW